MKTSDFDYNLPERLIAQNRVHPYDTSRLLILDKKSGDIVEKHFYDIIDYLSENDVLVFNNTKVFKARLNGKKETGAQMELLLLEPVVEGKKEYTCIIKGKVTIGTKIYFDDDFFATITKLLNNGDRVATFNVEGEALKQMLEKYADMPLPHYISDDKEKQADYQTIYANSEKEGSIAAPTAGFHFTNELIEKLKNKGVHIEYITLNVGIGTFRPVKSDNLEEHEMHYESYEIDPDTLQRLNSYKNDGKRIIAVGTTSTRTLEDSAGSEGLLEKTENNTNIFIYPPYTFKFVDSLITNFHLPKSTLIMLVSSLAGKDHVFNAYKYAVDNEFRFYSFGDAMFIK